jgi:hypothetical protein
MRHLTEINRDLSPLEYCSMQFFQAGRFLKKNCESEIDIFTLKNINHNVKDDRYKLVNLNN